ncbi:MAG: EamA family transporter, partial [Myxococcota bacterium]|nr:EamA family transporter [Myxococcota bacterium]
LTIAAWRAVLVALVFGVWAVVQGGGVQALVVDRATVRLSTIYGLALALASSTFVGGYALTTVANTIFLHNLAPAMTFPLAWWWFRERPRAETIAGAAIAVLGVALLSGASLFHFAHFANPRFLAGDGLAVLSAVGYAAVLVTTRATRTAQTPIVPTLFLAWCVAAVVLCLVALMLGTLAISGSALLWVFGLAVVATNIPFFLLNLGMKEIPAGLASLLSLSEVLFATLIGLLIYSEHLAPVAWFGGGLLALGVLYPFLQTTSETEPGVAPQDAELDSGTFTARCGRLGLALVLLNTGALLTVLQGQAHGGILAWAGAACLLRLAAPVTIQTLVDGLTRT